MNDLLRSSFGGVHHVEDVLGHCGHRLVNVPDGPRRSSPRERSSPKESAGSRRSPAWTTKTWWLKQNASSWDISWKDEPLRTIAWAYQPVSSAEVAKVKNYHILERIGEGSFGKVYRGRRKYSGHIVALKFVTKQGKSARDLENLRQEINILRRLNHCNIIAMMDSFETDGEFCMVTNMLKGAIPDQKIAIQLIQALHVLHSNRIIHRDMKPQNILIGSRQQIKLCDFGFARAIAHDTSLLRSIKGTPLYMAPELVQEKPYNYTVDLGKPPFYTDRIVSLIQMIVRDDVEYPSTMSADFQSFLKGLLNKDPAQRLKWPKILDHPFIQETPEQLETRLQLERQPDAKCWSPLQPFPVLTLVREDTVPMESSSLRDVRHLYKLRVKVHSEVGSQLLSSGVGELIALLGDEINERVRLKQSETEEEDIGEEDADQSTICCILKILMHACRSSAPLSKKLTVTKIIEQYFATELLSVILRRGVLPKRQIWRCAQTLFPALHETCNIDESALGNNGNPDALEPMDKELWSLVVHGALTSRCSDAIFRLFSNNSTDDDGITSKAQMLTSYNIRAQGLLDSGIVFLLRIASKAAQSRDGTNANRSEEMNMFILEVFDDMMSSGGGDLLSPWGLFCFLKLLRIVREMQCNEPQMEIAVNEHLLLHLVNLLELKHIEYLFHWPEIVGGGSNAVKALVHATVKVLGIPFAHSVSEELLVDTQEILYDAKCVQKLLGVLRFVFSTKELQLEASVLELPISFLSRLVTSSTHFGSQFVEADGMLVIKECGMLSSNCSPSLIIDTLLIVSQLARSSQNNYDCILNADLLSEFYELTQHSEAMVRAKALNCIGNLCRHSTLFYQQFITPLNGKASNSVLSGMIRGLSDPDNYVRRFACFAIGNAAFHNGDLYDGLRPAIPLLVQNLHNDEDKTRSNAGGALGNLVRNSDELCEALCTHQAPWELFELAMTETSTASRRIVLFSLGNFCVYPECFNFLVEAEPEFVEELEHLYDEVVADEVSRRNIRRILSKIEALDSEEGKTISRTNSVFFHST
ncbi:Protein kinase, ATP binding site [Phytophthora cactorum]|nr:Protein kinase, ATP binding site [Phytophthora cactorum]